MSLTAEYMGAPMVTTSGQLQGILAENEAVMYGPAIQPEDPKPRRAAAIPASVITGLLTETAGPPVSGGEDAAPSENEE